MQIYAFVPDAFGGHGGISVYNKDLLSAFTQHPEVERVIALPRVVQNEVGRLPDKLLFREEAASSKLRYIAALLKDLPRIARSDMLYCGHLNLAPLVHSLGKTFGIPVLGALYGIEAWRPGSTSARKRAAQQLDLYFSISAYTRDRFLQWANVEEDRIHLLPNAIHLSDFAPSPRSAELMARYGISADDKVMLTFGRLVSRERAKGFDEVLDVMPELMERHPGLRYIIAGDGPDRSRLEKRAAESGLVDSVIFTGMVDEGEKADIYKLADLYVMPSCGEGFGFVFLEALACGVPVVASSVDGSRDAVRDGMLGPMVDPADKAALVSAIEKGLKTPKGVPEGLSYFDFPNFVKRVNAIVDSLVKR